MKLKIINGNPWGASRPDCTIRALAIALNYSYIELCKIFRLKWKWGEGVVSENGMQVDRIMKTCEEAGFSENSGVDDAFASIFDDDNVIVDFDDEYVDTSDSLIDVEMGNTIFDFADMYPPGKYILFVRPTKKKRLFGDKDWHTTYLDNYTKILYDGFNPAEGTYVFGWIKLKESAILPSTDPKSRVAELKKIESGWMPKSAKRRMR